jgi:hypothetical protein|nr:MAG TPA: DNA binding domain protein [Caudoviricetes sp.]
MSNAIRFDSKGNRLQVGESQNSKDGRYCYKYTDKVSRKRRTIYALSLEELRYKENLIRSQLLSEINSKKSETPPYILELIYSMNKEFKKMQDEIFDLKEKKRDDMSRIFAQVYEEKDYSKFKRLENNRDVTESRKEKLKASIASGEILNPIIVNEKMEIIDGQGRYEAKKELGLPIQYVISKGAGIKECQKMNKYNTKWSYVDYIQSYAALGNENYINFQNACEKLKCPPTKTATFANLLNGGNLTDKIQDGTLKFDESLYKYTIRNFNYFSDILEALMHQGRVNQSFVLASIILFDHPKYDHKKMIEQCKRYRTSFVQMARREDQVKELQRIYNMRAKNKIYFEDYFRVNNRRGNSEKTQEFNWEKENDVSTLKRA